MSAAMWLRRVLGTLALILAAALVYRLGVIWSARVFHPYDLEWMEGGMLAHAWRLSEGRALYTEPSAHWIPYIYPAGYAQLLAWLSPVVGLGYAQGRLVSLLGTLAAALALPFMTWRHHRAMLPGLLGAAAFLGTYDDVGCFFDLVRTDGLSVALVGWSVVLALDEDRRLRDLAALLLFFAFAVKQNFALWGVPLALGLWLRLGWKDALRFGLISALPALAWTGLQQWQSGGLYIDYIVTTPATHGMRTGRGFPGMPREVVVAVPGALVVCALLVLDSGRRKLPSWSAAVIGVAAGLAAFANHSLSYQDSRYAGYKLWVTDAGFAMLAAAIAVSLWMALRGGRREPPPWTWVFGAGVGGVALVSAGLMRAHVGGFVNVLIPLYWVVCAGAATCAARFEARHLGALGALPTLVLGAQLAVDHQRLDDKRYLPRQGAVEANDAIVEALRHVEGPVFSPFNPWLVYQAGGEPGVHLISIWDTTKSRSPFPGTQKAVRQAVLDQEFAAVLDGNRTLRAYGVDEAYGGAPSLAQSRMLWPVNGYRAFALRLRFPKSSPPVPASPPKPSDPAAPEDGSQAP